MSKLYIRNLLWVVLFVFSTTSYGQGLLEDEEFLYEKSNLYEEWLNQTQFSSVLSLDDIEVEEDSVVVWMSISNEASWHGLKMSYDNQNWSSISEILFLRLVHLLELKKEEAIIKITDLNQYSVSIYFKNDSLKIDEPKTKDAVSNDITLPLVELNDKYVKLTKDNIKGNIDFVRKKILQFLDEYYSKKYARYPANKAKYKPIDTYSNYIDIVIYNITDEIIKDKFIGYYEYISINIKIEQLNENVVIKYNLQGKYGSGIFSAPRKSDYIDMEEEYKEYLDEYNKELKLNIRNYLLNN